MFHNVLMTTLTPLRDTNEIHCWDNRPFTTIWPESKSKAKTKDAIIKKTITKKIKRNRTMFTTEQVRELEKIFTRTKYIDIERRKEIAECLKMDQKCIKIWFQNRRMKEKKELSESCETASDGISESVSPSLDVLNNIQHNPYSHSYEQQSYVEPTQNYHYEQGNYHDRPPQYYYNAPDNYLKSEIPQYQSNNYYETASNSPNIDGANYNNIGSNEFTGGGSYSSQYYPENAEFRHYYNMGSIIYDLQAKSNIHDWSISDYDTNYQ